MSLWFDYIPHFWTINHYQHDNVRQNHTAKITKWDHKLFSTTKVTIRYINTFMKSDLIFDP